MCLELTIRLKIISLSVPQPFDLFDTFLHELGHAIDNQSGKTVYDYNAYKVTNETAQKNIRTQGRLSYSDEFLKVFEE